MTHNLLKKNYGMTRFKDKSRTVRGFIIVVDTEGKTHALDKKQHKRYKKALKLFNDRDVAIAEGLYKPIRVNKRLVYPIFHVTGKKIKKSEVVNT